MEFEPMQCTEDDAISHDEFRQELENGDAFHDDVQGADIPEGMDEDVQMEESNRANPAEEEDTPSSSQESGPQFSQGGNQGSSQQSNVSEEQHQRRSFGRMPSSYMRAESITDATRYPLELRRYYHEAGLLVPKLADLKSIESQSKIFSMETVGDLHLSAGDRWSFVDRCPAGLSDELRKVVYLFDVLNSLSNHHPWNKYVVPTDDLGGQEYTRLKPKFAPDQKTITGVLYSEMQDSDEREERFDSMLEDDSGDLQSGTVYRSMPLLCIDVGFTAAVFRAAGSDKEEFALFGVVTVTGLANVDTLELIKVSSAPTRAPTLCTNPLLHQLSPTLPARPLTRPFAAPTHSHISCQTADPFGQERLLAPPPVSLKSFAEVSKRNRELTELFEHVIIYQASRVMGDMSTERPKDYFCNPGGRLGIDKVCHPGFEPYKMCRLLMKQHERPASIKIIGYPDIDWMGDKSSGRLKEHWNYIRGQRAHQMHARTELSAACVEMNKKKDKRSDQEEKEEWLVVTRFGWPVRRVREWYTEFVAGLCPLNMRLRRLRDLDPSDSFHRWGLNAGPIPPLALCILRCCLLFDPNSPEASQLDGVLLRELDVKWDMALIRQRFYSSDNKVLDHIAVPGCQVGNYKEIMRFIRKSVETGTMSPSGGVQMLRKAMEYGMSVFVGMAESNSFLSQRVTQAMETMRRVEHKEKQRELSLGQGLRTYRKHLLELDNVRSPNLPVLLCPYDRARRFLLLGLVDVNRFEHLNSGNLQLKIEIMISMISHTMGYDNESHQPFGRGIELAPGCGTLKKKLGINGGKFMDVRVVENANSAGKDFSSKKVSDAFRLFSELYDMRKCYQGLRVLRRFTPVALENLTTLQFENGEIIAYPDETLNGFFYIITESRGNTEGDQDALIKFAYTRGDKQDDASLTTCEGKNKVRSLMWKESMSSFGLCTRCSNEPLPSAKAHEQSDTLAAVTAMLEAGSSPYEPGAQEGQFSSIQSSPYEARSVPLEGHTSTFGPTLLAGTHLHCTTYMGLPNVLGTYLCEINPPVLATLDWLTFFSQKHLESMFHSRCKGTHLLRLQRVYEARATSFTAWCKMIQHLTDCPDRDAAIRRAVAAFQCDAIALTDCVSMLWSLVRRCLHWGPVLYASCFIRESSMPIVPTQILVELLKADQPPLSGSVLRPWYNRVRVWLEGCVAQNRFCPAEGANLGGEVTEYLSSAGQSDGSVERGSLRVNLAYNAWNDKMDPRAAPNRLAAAAYKMFGAELTHSCSVSRDALACAIEDMLTEFDVDIQKLLEVNMFDMQRHLQFFGIKGLLNFKCQDRFGAHPFLAKAVWQRVRGERFADVLASH